MQSTEAANQEVEICVRSTLRYGAPSVDGLDGDIGHGAALGMSDGVRSRSLADLVRLRGSSRTSSLGTAILFLLPALLEDGWGVVPQWQKNLMSRRFNPFVYVDVRDVAAACASAPERPVTGVHVLNIGVADTCMDMPSSDLAAAAFPGVPLRRPFDRHEALVSNDTAADLIGYRPRYSWRDHLPSPSWEGEICWPPSADPAFCHRPSGKRGVSQYPFGSGPVNAAEPMGYGWMRDTGS